MLVPKVYLITGCLQDQCCPCLCKVLFGMGCWALSVIHKLQVWGGLALEYYTLNLTPHEFVYLTKKGGQSLSGSNLIDPA